MTLSAEWEKIAVSTPAENGRRAKTADNRAVWRKKQTTTKTEFICTCGQMIAIAGQHPFLVVHSLHSAIRPFRKRTKSGHYWMASFVFVFMPDGLNSNGHRRFNPTIIFKSQVDKKSEWHDYKVLPSVKMRYCSEPLSYCGGNATMKQ